MKKLAIVLSLILLLTSCSQGVNKSEQKKEKNLTQNNNQVTETNSSIKKDTKGQGTSLNDGEEILKRSFVVKKTSYEIDNTTEVLLDAPVINQSEIKSYYKHGDHWHVFTNSGKEYITYKDPALMSEQEQSNLSAVARETEKYSPEKIVEHMEKIYQKDGSLILKWLHVDHYHDSIYGISEDIEGVIVEKAPSNYTIDLTKEIPSLVENKRYFKYGNKVYYLAGKSQAEIKESLVVKDKSEINEGDYEKYGPEKIVKYTEKIYTKKNYIVIKWLHVDHYHESVYGISDDIDGLLIEKAPKDYIFDLKNEIPSSVKNRRYFRAGHKIYYVEGSIIINDQKLPLSKIANDNENKNKEDKQSNNDEDNTDTKNDSDNSKNSSDKSETNDDNDTEKNIPAIDIVKNIKNIYTKKGEIVFHWLHNTEHPHYHDSIVGISDDIENVNVIEIDSTEANSLEEISSSVPNKRFYRNYGEQADTVYYVLKNSNNDGNNNNNNNNNNDDGSSAGNSGSSSGSNSQSDDTNTASDDTVVEENNISFVKDVLPNIKKIYKKKGFLTVQWWHVDHMHNDAVILYNYLEGKIVKAPENYMVDESKEIKSELINTRYFKAIDKIYYLVKKVDEGGNNLFEKVIDNGDQVKVTYQGTEYLISPKEYQMALKEGKYRPSPKLTAKSNITLDPRFDDTRTIVLMPKDIKRGYEPWAIWKDENRNDLATHGEKFKWYISYAESNEYKEITGFSGDGSFFESSVYKFSKKDNGALLKVQVINDKNEVLEEVKYNIIVRDELHPGEVTEHTKERIRNTKKVFYKGKNLAIKWWHVNHWHFEPVAYYDDISIEKAKSNYIRKNENKVRELSLDEDLLDKVYYIEKDKFVYVEVDRKEFLELKIKEIIDRIKILENVNSMGRDEKLLNEYTKNEQTFEINRVFKLYSELPAANKAALKQQRDELVTLAKTKNIDITTSISDDANDDSSDDANDDSSDDANDDSNDDSSDDSNNDANGDVNDDTNTNQDGYKITFEAEFTNGEAIPNIGIYYLHGVKDYIDKWQNASSDLAFGGGNKEEDGKKHPHYLKVNGVVGYGDDKKTGLDKINLSKEDADYIYVRLAPRPTDKFVKLLVNDKELTENIYIGNFESNPIKIAITKDTVVKLVCSNPEHTEPLDDNDDEPEIEEKQSLIQVLVKYRENGEIVNPSEWTENNKLKFETDVLKTVENTKRLMDFVLYEHNSEGKTDVLRRLTNKFTIINREKGTGMFPSNVTTEYTNLNEFKKAILGSKKTDDTWGLSPGVVIIIEIEKTDNQLGSDDSVGSDDSANSDDSVDEADDVDSNSDENTETYNVYMGIEWDWNSNFEPQEKYSKDTKLKDIDGALDFINKAENDEKFLQWSYLNSKSDFNSKAIIQKGELSEKTLANLINAYGNISIRAEKKDL